MALPDIKGLDWISTIGGGSYDWVVYLLIVVFFLAIGFIVYMQLKSRGKTYKTTIWEDVGGSWRKVMDTLQQKEDKDKTTMFELKRAKVRVPVTMKDATVTANGKVTFDLIKVEDNYYPMRPTQTVQIYETDKEGEIKKDDAGNPIKRELKLIEFGAEFKLHDIKAAAHKIGQDAKIYTFMEKNAAMMQFIATMASIMIPFALMLIVIMKVGPLLKGMADVGAATTQLVPHYQSIATSLEAIVQHLGGIIPPPG